MPPDLGEKNISRGTDPRINDHNVNRPLREIAIGGVKHQGGAQNILGGDAVGDVDDEGVWAPAEDNALHDTGVFVLEAEIRQQGDDHCHKRTLSPRSEHLLLDGIPQMAESGLRGLSPG